MKVLNTELYMYLKGPTVIYRLPLLAARLLEVATKLESLDCSHLFYSKHRSIPSFQVITLRVSDDTKLSRFTLLR